MFEWNIHELSASLCKSLPIFQFFTTQRQIAIAFFANEIRLNCPLIPVTIDINKKLHRYNTYCQLCVLLTEYKMLRHPPSTSSKPVIRPTNKLASMICWAMEDMIPTKKIHVFNLESHQLRIAVTRSHTSY